MSRKSREFYSWNLKTEPVHCYLGRIKSFTLSFVLATVLHVWLCRNGLAWLLMLLLLSLSFCKENKQSFFVMFIMLLVFLFLPPVYYHIQKAGRDQIKYVVCRD